MENPYLPQGRLVGRVHKNFKIKTIKSIQVDIKCRHQQCACSSYNSVFKQFICLKPYYQAVDVTKIPPQSTRYSRIPKENVNFVQLMILVMSLIIFLIVVISKNIQNIVIIWNSKSLILPSLRIMLYCIRLVASSPSPHYTNSITATCCAAPFV